MYPPVAPAVLIIRGNNDTGCPLTHPYRRLCHGNERGTYRGHRQLGGSLACRGGPGWIIGWNNTIPPRYAGNRFPAEIISHAVWLYFCFPLGLRMVEELLAARGIIVSHETVRQWALKFGQAFASGGRTSAG